MADIRIIPSIGAINVTGSADFRGTGASSVLFVSGSGNVGIGTSTPGSKLHVAGAIKATALTGHMLGDGTDTSRALSILNSNLAQASSQVITLGRANSNNNQAEISFYLDQTGSAANRLSLGLYNSSDTLNILGSGKVGINTTSPGVALHIGPSALIANYNTSNTTLAISDVNNGAQLILRGGSPKILFDSSGGGNGEIYLDSANLTFYKNTVTSPSTALLFLSSSGNLGVGTPDPGSKLVVAGGTDTSYNDGTLKVVGNIALNSYNNLNPALNRWVLRVRAGGTEGSFDIYDARNAESRLHISGSGQVGLGAYGSGTHTGTAAYRLSVDSSGNIIEESLGAGAIDGLGSSNYLARWEDTDTLTSSSIYETNGQVGINTTVPNAAFKVYSPTQNVTAYFESGDEDVWISLKDSNSGTYGVLLGHDPNANELFKIADDNAYERLIMTTGGNVSIGDRFQPQARLHVSGASDVLKIEGSGSTITDIQGSQGQLFSVTDSLVGSLMSVNDISGIPILEVFDTDKVVAGTYGQNTLVVTGSSVGIGTGVPTTPLRVQGGASMTGGWNKTTTLAATYPTLVFNSNENKWAGIGYDFSVDGIRIWTNGTSDDVNGTGNERVSIIAGNVGIGTSDPSEKLHVNNGGILISGNGTYKTGISNGTGAQLWLTTQDSSGNQARRLYITGNDSTNFEVGIARGAAGSENSWVVFDSQTQFVGINNSTPDSPLNVVGPGNEGKWRVQNYGGMYFGNNTDAGYERYIHGRSDGALSIGRVSGSLLTGGAGGYAGTAYDHITILANGNVGIGTTSPGKLLTVNGESQFIGESFFNAGFDVTAGTGTRFRNDVPLNFGTSRVFELVYDSTTDKLEFNSGSDAIMSLDGDGNLELKGDLTVDGIITAKEFHTTFVSASIIYQSGSTQFGDTSDDNHDFIGYVTVTRNPGASQGTVMVIENTGDYGSSSDLILKNAYDRDIGIKFETGGGFYHQWLDSNGDDAMIFSAAGTTRTTDATLVLHQNHDVVIPNGSVGIGTTSPSEKLQVEGNVLVKNTEGFYLQPSGSSGGFVGNYFTSLGGGSFNHLPFVWRVAGGNRMVIDTTGYVGIGTTNPTYLLDVAGEIGINSYIRHNDDTDTYFGFNSTDSFKIRTGNGDRVIVDSNGTYVSGQFSQGVSIANKVLNYGAEFRSTDASIQIVMGRDGGASGSGAIGADENSIFSAWNVDTVSEKFRIGKSGSLHATYYGSGNNTGTVAYRLGVDSSGNIIEESLGAGAVDGSGTANYIAKWSDSDTLTDSVLYDNGTNLGLGTTTPLAGLHINASGVPQLLLDGGSDTTGDIVVPSGEILQIGHWNTSLSTYTDRLRIITDGNVGINSTSPSSKLDVGGDIKASDSISVVHSSGLGFYSGPSSFQSFGSGVSTILLQGTTSNGRAGALWFKGYQGDDVAALYVTDDVQDDYGTTLVAYSGSIRFATQTLAAEKMIITSGGSVGIGVISPSKTLHVYSDNDAPIRVESSDGTTGIQFKDPGGDNSLFYVGSGDYFYTTATLGVGTTSPLTKLHVSGSIISGKPVTLYNSQVSASGYAASFYPNPSYSQQSINMMSFQGNWLDGIAASDTHFGIGLQYENLLRGGISYDHRSSERMNIWSSYGPIMFYTPDSVNGDLDPYAGSSTPRLTIEPGGDVGIGTTNPAYKLDVNGASRFTGNLIVTGSTIISENVTAGNSNSNVHNFIGNSFTIQGSAPYLYLYDDNNSYGGGATMGIYFNTTGGTQGFIGVPSTSYNDIYITNDPAQGTVGGETSGHAHILLLPHDNVGIGVEDPAAKLEIDGTLYIDAADNSGSIQLGASADYPNLGKEAQLHLAGATNYHWNLGGKRRIFISDYDNDGGSGNILFEAETENNETDIKFTGRYGSTPSIGYFAGSVGIGMQPATWTLEVKGGIVSEDDSTTSQLLMRQVDANVAEFQISPSSDSPSNYFQFRPNSQGADSGVRVYDRYETDYIYLRHDGGSGHLGTKASAGYQAGNLNFLTAGDLAMTIESGSSNIGIGTGTPSYKLDVNGGSNISVARFYNSAATSTILYYGDTGNTQYTETQYLADDGVASIFKAGSGYTSYGGRRAFNIYNEKGGISLLPNNATSPVLFATGSSVGIGTTEPTSKLQVLGQVKADNFYATGTNYGVFTNSIYFNNTESTGYYTTVNGLLAFDENFYGDSGYGTGTYDPAQAFTTNGGGLVIKNEDGWGALISSQNMRWLNADFATLNVQGNAGVEGDLTVDGIITAKEFHTTFVSASIIFQSGSTQFGNDVSDEHVVYGNFRFNDNNGNTRLNIGNITGGSPYVSKIWSSNYHLTLEAVGTGQGQIRFNTGTTAASERMRILQTGEIGVGISSPETALHIKDTGWIDNTVGSSILRLESTDAVGAGLTMKNTDGDHWSIYNGGQSSWAGRGILGFVYHPSGSAATGPKVVVNTSGNVGVGVTNPGAKLHVNGDVIRVVNSTYAGIESHNSNGTWESYVGTESGGGGSRYNNASSLHTFYANSTAVVVISGSNGNVGIGTTVPDAKLDVRGISRISGDYAGTGQDPLLQFYNTDASLGSNQILGTIDFYQSDPSGGGVGVVSRIRAINDSSFKGEASLTFHTGEVGVSFDERMRISSAGNVGIGTDTPGAKLEVNGAGELVILDSSAAYGWIRFKDAGTTRGFIGYGDSGNIFTGASTNSVSLRSNADLHLGGGGNNLQMTLDGTNVGIGTSTPAATLHVDGSTLIEGTATVNKLTVTGSIRVGLDGSTPLIDTTNSTANYVAVQGAMYVLNESDGGYGDIAYTVGPQSYQPSIKTGTDASSTSGGAYVNGNFPNTAADSAGVADATERTFSASLGLLQSDGARLPRLEEVLSGYGRGTGDSTDSEWIWTQTKGAKDYVYQVRGDVSTYPEYRLVDPNNSSNTARVRRFFDISKANLPVYYDNNSYIRGKEIRAEHSDGLKLYDDGGNGIFIEDGGNVGIGTTGPDIELHVYDADNWAQIKVETGTDGFDASVAYSQAGTIKGITGYDDSTDTVAIKYGTFGGNGIDIKSDGNVGLGVTNPLYKLHIAGDAAFKGVSNGLAYAPTENSSETTRYFLMFDYTNNASFPFLTNRTPSGAVVIKTGTAAGGAENEHFRIEGGDGKVDAYFTNANVGIGTSAPAEALHVQGGNVRITNNSPILYFYDTDVTNLYHRILGGGNAGLEYSADIGNVTAGYHRWDIANSEKMRLTEGGNLGIGTASPTAGLHVSKSMGGAWLASLENQNDSGHGLLITAGGTTGTRYITQWKDAALNERFHMQDTGEAYFAGSIGIGVTPPAQPLHVVGNAEIEGNLYVNEYIYHNDDTNTYMRFLGDYVQFDVGGLQFFTMTENSTQDTIVINEDSGDIDFRVESNNNTHLLFTDGGQDRVGINSSDPQAKFFINNDQSWSAQDLGSSSSGSVAFGINGRNGATHNFIVSSNGTTDYTMQVVASSTSAGDININPYGGGIGIARNHSGHTVDIGGTTRIAPASGDGHLIITHNENNKDAKITFMEGEATNYKWTLGYDDGQANKFFFNAYELELGDDGSNTVMTLDPVTQWVGVGTTAPTAKFTVRSGISGYASSLATSVTTGSVHFRTHAGDSTITSFGAITGGAGYIQRSNGAGTTSYALTLNPWGGNVGIGVTNPSYKLQVNGTGADSFAIDVASTAGTTDQNAIRYLVDGVLKAQIGVAIDAGRIITDASANDYIIKSWNNIRFGNDLGNHHATITNSGDVGIGITNPSARLHVYSPTQNVTSYFESGDAEAWISLKDSNSGTYGVLLGHDPNANELFKIADSNAYEKLIMTTGGDVSIGDRFQPQARLHVSGASDVFLVEGSGSTLADIQGSQGQLFSVTDSLVGSLMSVNDISGIPILEVFDTDKVVMGTYGQNTLVVTGSLVGIGTANPGAFSGTAFASPILDLFGSFNIRGLSADGASVLNMGGDTYRKAAIYTSIGTNTPYLAFGTTTSGTSSSTAEAMRINDSQNVGIGTVSPSYRLHVDNDALNTNNPALYVSNPNSSTAAVIAQFVGDSDAIQIKNIGTGDYAIYNTQQNNGIHLYDGTGGVEIAYAGSTVLEADSTGGIKVTGQLSATADVIAYSSDERLKENIKPIENAVDKVKQLNGVTFDWNDKSEELGFEPSTKLNDVGVIAQEVEKIFPQLVHLAPFDIGSDEEGNTISKSGEDYKTVNYSRLTPVLIEAIKEQQVTVETQQKEIDELKSELKAIRDMLLNQKP